MSKSGKRRRTVLRRGSSRVAREIAASTFTFTERTPLEHGLADVFRGRIVPVLRRQEQSRQAMRAKAMKWLAVAAATRGRGFYLAIPRGGDFLALGSLFRPLKLAEDDIHQCLADLALPRRAIAALGTGRGGATRRGAGRFEPPFLPARLVV